MAFYGKVDISMEKKDSYIFPRPKNLFGIKTRPVVGNFLKENSRLYVVVLREEEKIKFGWPKLWIDPKILGIGVFGLGRHRSKMWNGKVPETRIGIKKVIFLNQIILMFMLDKMTAN